MVRHRAITRGVCIAATASLGGFAGCFVPSVGQDDSGEDRSQQTAGQDSGSAYDLVSADGNPTLESGTDANIAATQGAELALGEAETRPTDVLSVHITAPPELFNLTSVSFGLCNDDGRCRRSGRPRQRRGAIWFGELPVGPSGLSSGWDSLDAGRTYTVFAAGHSALGNPLAAACASGLRPRGTKAYIIPLSPVCLRIAGTYDAIQILSFDRAYDGVLLDALASFVDTVEHVEAWLMPGIFERVVVSTGAPVNSQPMVALESDLESAATWLASAASPDWRLGIGSAVQGMLEATRDITISALSGFEDVGGCQTISGWTDWQQVVLHWSFHCPTWDAPDYDPLCAVQQFQLPLSYANYAEDARPGWDFGGKLESVEWVRTDERTFAFDRGALMKRMFGEVLIPRATGAASVESAIGSLVDCAGLSGFVMPSTLAGLGLSLTDISAACTDTVQAATTLVSSALDADLPNTSLDLVFRARLLDRDQDLQVDELLAGIVSGHEVTNSASGAIVSGTWRAERTK